MFCTGGKITGVEGGYTTFSYSGEIEEELLIMINESPVVLLLYFLGGEGRQVGWNIDTFRWERSTSLAFLSRDATEG